MFVHVLKLGHIRSRLSELSGFKFRGVCVTLNFQRPLAAKLCVGDEHVLEVQVWYGPHAKCGGARPSRAARGRKRSTFLSVTLLNDKVSERHLAINALEFGDCLGIIG